MKDRINSIDIFRGIVIAAMLLVENHTNGFVYPELKHSIWNGCTLADLVLPFFIFISGIVVPISIKNRESKGKSKLIILMHIFERGIILFCIGLFINAFPYFDFNSLRITGVLQRIAIVILIASILELYTNTWVEIGATVFVMVVYILLVKFKKEPGYITGNISDINNVLQYIDIKFLKGHMYTPTWDPEGIISNFSSISTAILGVISGKLIFTKQIKRLYKYICIIIYGSFLLVASYLLSTILPINKNIWDTSYVLFTAGLGVLLMSSFYIICDELKYKEFFYPFKILGESTIFIYVVSEILSKSLWLIQVFDGSTASNINLRDWISNKLVFPWAGEINASLYFSVSYVILWFIIIRSFERKNTILKI